MRRDRFGNIFFINNDDGMQPGMFPNQPNMPRAVTVADVLENRPGDGVAGAASTTA